MSNGELEGKTDVAVWYSEAIGKVRVASTPGGDAFNIGQAEELRDELAEAIEQAKDHAE